MKVKDTYTKISKLSKEQIKMLYALESKSDYYSDKLEDFEAQSTLLSQKQYDILTLFLELKRLNHSYEIDGYDYIVLNLSTLERALGIASKNISKYMRKLRNYAILDWNAVRVNNSIKQYDTIIKFDSKGIIKLLNCVANGINKKSSLLQELKSNNTDVFTKYINKELKKYQSLLAIKEENSELKKVMNKIKKGFVSNMSLEQLTEIVTKDKAFMYKKVGNSIEVRQIIKYNENYYISVIDEAISALIGLKMNENAKKLMELAEKLSIQEKDEQGRIISCFIDDSILENNESKYPLINIYSFYLIYNKLKFIISKIKNLESKKISCTDLANVLIDRSCTESSIFDTTSSTTQSFSNFLNTVTSNVRNSSNYFILDRLPSKILTFIKFQKEKFLKYSAGACQNVLSVMSDAENKMFKLVYNFLSGGKMRKPKDFVEKKEKQIKVSKKIENQIDDGLKLWNAQDNFSVRREKQLTFITPYLVDDEVKLKCIRDFIDLRKPKSIEFQDELCFIASNVNKITAKMFIDRLNDVKKAEQKGIHCKTLGLAKNNDILGKQDKLYYQQEESRLEKGIEGNKRKLENVLTGEILEILENDKNDYLETLFINGENRECKISKKNDIYTITYRNKDLEAISSKYKEVM